MRFILFILCSMELSGGLFAGSASEANEDRFRATVVLMSVRSERVAVAFVLEHKGKTSIEKWDEFGKRHNMIVTLTDVSREKVVASVGYRPYIFDGHLGEFKYRFPDGGNRYAFYQGQQAGAIIVIPVGENPDADVFAAEREGIYEVKCELMGLKAVHFPTLLVYWHKGRGGDAVFVEIVQTEKGEVQTLSVVSKKLRKPQGTGPQSMSR